MSYKIQYSPETAYLYPKIAQKRRFRAGRWIIAAGVIAAALWLHFQGIPDFIIPGDPAITKAAASALVVDIQNGTDVGDAVTTFCKAILDGAQTSY